MDREELLQRAENHLFSTGLDDSAAWLGLINMKYGLAKIHWVQEMLGLEPDAVFIASPDLTVTRNVNRWKSGLGYGGKLVWGDGQQEFIVLDVKPNCCGMLVGGLESVPSIGSMIQRVGELENDAISVEGVPVKWDFGISNHFLSIFQVFPLIEEALPPYVFILHCSGSELRGESALGDGLYWDRSETLRRKATEIETPLGPLRILTGSEARSYYAFYCQVDAFVKKRRMLAAERLFERYTLINNDPHQGLLNMNEMLLGSYSVQGEAIYPLALRADLPAYLIRGKPNLGKQVIETLGYGRRARQLGVYERLTSANLVPHGGGYLFPHIRKVLSVSEFCGERYFEINLGNGARQFITHTRDIPFTYRGQEVLERTLELGMGEPVARLEPVYGLKL